MRLAYTIADQCFDTTASTGIYNVSLGLLRSLCRDERVAHVRVFANSANAGDVPRSHHVDVERCDLGTGSLGGRLLWDHWRMYARLRNAGEDRLFLPKGFASVARSCPIRLAAFVHDIIPIVSAQRYPTWRRRRRGQYFERCYAATLKQADVIFTNTDFTRSELAAWASRRGLACPCMVVAGYGFRAGPGAGKQDRVLAFVRPEPHKRTDLCLGYLDRWVRERRFKGEVLCVGQLPAGMRLPGRPGWTMAGRMPADECVGAMAAARAVVFFSEYEGFGMPPVEATLAGSCCVYSDIPATREVMCGTGCAFENGSYASFGRAMDLAIETPAPQVGQWASQLAQRHNWEKVTERVVEGMAVAAT